MNFKNILVPTDFSKLSLSAAPYAVELAQKYNSKIHLLHVQEKTPPILAIRSLDVSEDRIRQMLDEEAERSMILAENHFRDLGFNNISSVIRKGIDYEEITGYCETEPIDLIVIATHGRTGVLRTLIGSVAEKVIRFCKCPVLVITPTEKDK